MTQHLLALALFSMLVLPPGFCQVRPGESPEREIRRQRQEFVTAMNARDPEKVFVLAAPNLALYAEGQRAVEGLENFRAMLQRMLESGMTWELRMETTRVESSGTLAVELGRYWKTIRRPDGTTRASEGKYVDVWKHQPDGRWLLIVHAPSDDPSPQPGRE